MISFCIASFTLTEIHGILASCVTERRTSIMLKAEQGTILLCKMRQYKGLERQRLIGLAVAGYNHARTITKASAKGLDAMQDDYNKGICSPGSLVDNPVR